MNNLISAIQFILLGLMARLSNQQINTNIIHVTIVLFNLILIMLKDYHNFHLGKLPWKPCTFMVLPN